MKRHLGSLPPSKSLWVAAAIAMTGTAFGNDAGSFVNWTIRVTDPLIDLGYPARQSTGITVELPIDDSEYQMLPTKRPAIGLGGTSSAAWQFWGQDADTVLLNFVLADLTGEDDATVIEGGGDSGQADLAQDNGNMISWGAGDAQFAVSMNGGLWAEAFGATHPVLGTGSTGLTLTDSMGTSVSSLAASCQVNIVRNGPAFASVMMDGGMLHDDLTLSNSTYELTMSSFESDNRVRGTVFFPTTDPNVGAAMLTLQLASTFPLGNVDIHTETHSDGSDWSLTRIWAADQQSGLTWMSEIPAGGSGALEFESDGRVGCPIRLEASFDENGVQDGWIGHYVMSVHGANPEDMATFAMQELNPVQVELIQSGGS